MFNIGAGEMMLILVVALLILGPQRLPELARGIGKFMREFRRQTDEVRNVVEREFYTMDQDISREPTPPVRPGTSFAYNPPPLPDPSALPSPDAPVAAAPEAGLPGPVDAAPASILPPELATSGTQVLELDATGPRQLEPSVLRESAPSTPGTPPEPSAPHEPAPPTPDVPVPVPGTVARNAPKRS
jgi:sec-independent protein translocase protein TatB